MYLVNYVGVCTHISANVKWYQTAPIMNKPSNILKTQKKADVSLKPARYRSPEGSYADYLSTCLNPLNSHLSIRFKLSKCLSDFLLSIIYAGFSAAK